MSDAGPLRLLLVGCGGVATRAHLAALLAHPDRLRLVAACDPLPAARAEIAGRLREFGPVDTFDDLESTLAAVRGRVDAAVVTTPHHLHFPQAAACLRAGLPVLVEKPVTCTLDELRRLQELERPGVFVQAGQMQRFGEEENWLKRWLGSADFGEPRLFNLDIYQNIEGYVSDKPDAWILDKRRAGGGVVISVAVHILDLLRYWFEDDFVEVTARGRFDPPLHHGAESTCVALLRTRRGLLGTLNASYTVARTPYSQRSLVFGSTGTLAQHLEPIGGGYAGPYYIATSGGRPSPVWSMMYSGFEPVAGRIEAETGRRPAAHPASFVTQLLSFAEAVRSGRPGENSLARNLNTLALIDALGRALESGRPEAVALS
jgi:UDP-N-acetylglucosamine 3-dehydrogenase